MRTQSPDTHIDAEMKQVEILRKMSPTERFAKAANLTSFVMNQSKRAIKNANPNLSEFERKIIFISIHYGEELAEKARKYWQEKNETK